MRRRADEWTDVDSGEDRDPAVGAASEPVAEALAIAALDRLLTVVRLAGSDESDTARDPSATPRQRGTAELVARWLRDHPELLEQRQRILELERELLERNRFTAMVVHELKAPAAVVTGWTHILREELGADMPDTVGEGLAAIDASARRLLDRMARLHDEHSARERTRTLRLGPHRLDRLVEQLAGELGAVSRSHELEVAVAAPVGATVDPEALRIVLEHLVENAAKYAPGGTAIRLVVGPTPAGRAAVEVVDRGPGLPTGIDLFAPFTRGTGAGNGLGLGLHIVQTLVHAMDGDVVGENNPDGPGARFRTAFRTARVAS